MCRGGGSGVSRSITTRMTYLLCRQWERRRCFFFQAEGGIRDIGVTGVQTCALPISIGDGSVLDYLHHLILPSLVLALVHVAIWSRYMRTATLDVISQDFVKTARAKGLSERRVLLKHVVGNALLPMITLAGMQLPSLLTGALVTETVFTWPGMGRLFLDALGYSDYPVVMGLLMFSAILVILGNLIADIVIAIVDPRIRLA